MKKKLILAVLGGAVFCAAASARPDYSVAVKADYDKSLAALWDHFHRNPELSFREFKTAARMAQELRAVPGMVVTEKVGQTGVVGVLKNGDGPVVLVRADMDGLPVQERSGLANASTVRQVGVDGLEMPVMHACGHDVHITSLVGTARQLAAMKDRWKGTVLFIVQPAEERVGGANAMIKDGLYTRFPKPDFALAFHVAAELETGKISASEAIQYSSADSVDIRVPGIATHGAAPQLGRDPVYIASQIVVALQSIISREKGPLEPGVITVGAFHAGTKHNIISEFADLQVTVRANSQDVRDKLIASIERVAVGIGRAHGLPEDKLPVVKVNESTPVTVNDAALARRLNGAIAKALGNDVVVPFRQTNMGAEDFAFFVDPKFNVPGYYFAVGGTAPEWMEAAKNGGKPVAGHHSPLFRIDPEPSVRLGIEAMTAAVLDLLGTTKS
ncbi:amidohydrolase [Sphingorhabdus sp. IMCC26285]|uniref:Amidohydrolase n=2 Tax=Sphingorhabdus profundilacus TaxID=2509718 RepID=A0A6I4M2Q4_9SPHN|nr:amidohydrolase [Sphingorhabdus profundilacus]